LSSSVTEAGSNSTFWFALRSRSFSVFEEKVAVFAVTDPSVCCVPEYLSQIGRHGRLLRKRRQENRMNRRRYGDRVAICADGHAARGVRRRYNPIDHSESHDLSIGRCRGLNEDRSDNPRRLISFAIDGYGFAKRAKRASRDRHPIAIVNESETGGSRTAHLTPIDTELCRRTDGGYVASQDGEVWAAATLARKARALIEKRKRRGMCEPV
jgi:hypothetical protein